MVSLPISLHEHDKRASELHRVRITPGNTATSQSGFPHSSPLPKKQPPAGIPFPPGILSLVDVVSLCCGFYGHVGTLGCRPRSAFCVLGGFGRLVLRGPDVDLVLFCVGLEGLRVPAGGEYQAMRNLGKTRFWRMGRASEGGRKSLAVFLFLLFLFLPSSNFRSAHARTE